MLKCYEVVVLTASVSSYASEVVDTLSKGLVKHKLYREHCRYSQALNFYVKDLTRLGRDLKDTIIVDNVPQSYCL